MTNKIEYFYRFNSWTTAPPHDPFCVSGAIVGISLSKFKVTKHTKKGVWIEYGFEKDRFILVDARKHFACSTISEARESFLARKRRQLGLLETQAENTRAVLIQAPDLMSRAAQQHGEQDG